MPGDVNMDDIINILDVIVIINMILGVEDENALADLNGDGSINIQDIILVINLILGPRFDSASSAQLIDTGSEMKMKADGYIGGVQMTLKHSVDFSIVLTDQAMDISNYRTVGNETILVIVAPISDELFTYSGDFEIVDIIVASSEGRIKVNTPIEFKLNSAYPNPFNPSTNISYSLPHKGDINLSVYNISGQLIQTLATGEKDAGSYSLVWDASWQPSGMYFLRLQTTNKTLHQKLMVVK
jgi:hypothetical protein